ncbi:hypothetical protein BX600DRAFT_442999 [Xylariales sp. PMI_506]|nr:hypothetical protein BX600DRAFT_442999 [Xylariales sp. PMI_506]
MGSLGQSPVSSPSAPYVHPSLSVVLDDPAKGRQVTCISPIRDGEVLLVDAPYALVPAMAMDEPPFYLCSRHECSRRIPKSPLIALTVAPKRTAAVMAAATTAADAVVWCLEEGCPAEVTWCSEECRAQDHRRHQMECPWLRSCGPEIRNLHGDSDFGLLWLIARILINKYLELAWREQPISLASPGTSDTLDQRSDIAPLSVSHFERKGWDAVWNLDGTVATFPTELVERWRGFAERYLTPTGPLGTAGDVADSVVSLICKVETNSFGLYPGVTGEYPVVSLVSRGQYYGGGIYPTAAMFNHACCPNVTHRLDDLGHRIFQANRDIQPGEECCITYFDLVEYMDATSRRDEVSKSWSFRCQCQRCMDEGEFELPHFLKEMAFD